ncbi:unnamed protein product [Allacma fusca]|uniref:Uncharacterized protein n=1 Tax=Allacma fusca TaxID=39272 RepID=A0A8J2PAR5_9HEXA|nr:unnamed protein product [Allacma fusca]
MGQDWKTGIGDYDFYYNSSQPENDTSSNATDINDNSSHQIEFIRSIVVSIMLGLIILSTIVGVMEKSALVKKDPTPLIQE